MFIVSGEVKLGKETRAFKKTIDAPTEARAREMVMANLGSSYGVTRNRILIKEVHKSS